MRNTCGQMVFSGARGIPWIFLPNLNLVQHVSHERASLDRDGMETVLFPIQSRDPPPNAKNSLSGRVNIRV